MSSNLSNAQEKDYDSPVAVYEVLHYLTKIKMADKTRKRYYKRGKKVSDAVFDKIRRGIYGYDSKGYLIDRITKEKVLANPNSHGKPRYEKLAGNKFSYAGWDPRQRAMLVEVLKEDYKSKIIPITVPVGDFPLRVEWDFYTTVKRSNFDLSNMWFYYKYFEDTLVDLGVFPDDSILYITHPPAPRLIPVEKWEDRKFVFRFYRDERPEIRGHKLWSASSS